MAKPFSSYNTILGAKVQKIIGSGTWSMEFLRLEILSGILSLGVVILKVLKNKTGCLPTTSSSKNKLLKN